ncbi:MAG: hypothetical protein IPP07_25165 [Holophagales bacterium]|nr:hypothetical protein [Holophagales bacterium]
MNAAGNGICSTAEDAPKGAAIEKGPGVKALTTRQRWPSGVQLIPSEPSVPAIVRISGVDDAENGALKTKTRPSPGRLAVVRRVLPSGVIAIAPPPAFSTGIRNATEE